MSCATLMCNCTVSTWASVPMSFSMHKHSECVCHLSSISCMWHHWILACWVHTHCPIGLSYMLLQSEIPSSICAKLRTVAASNNGVHTPRSLSAYASHYIQSFTCLYHQRLHATITIIACSHHIYEWCCSSCTSRSWWITQSMQHHRRGCNNAHGMCHVRFLGSCVWFCDVMSFFDASGMVCIQVEPVSILTHQTHCSRFAKERWRGCTCRHCFVLR